MLKGIYAISDTLLTPKDKLEQSLQAAIQGGIALFQLRDKESCDEEIAELCPKLERICKDSNVVFVLNDRVELAINLKVEALHIGKSRRHALYLRGIKANSRRLSWNLGCFVLWEFGISQSSGRSRGGLCSLWILLLLSHQTTG